MSLLNYATGSAHAHLWANIGDCCAIGAISHELNLVFKDYQRDDENAGEEAVNVMDSKNFEENEMKYRSPC